MTAIILLIIFLLGIILFFYREFKKQRTILKAIKAKSLELKEKNKEEAISFLKKNFEKVVEFIPDVFVEKEFKEFRQQLRFINNKRYPYFGMGSNSNENVLIYSYLEEKALEEDSDEISKEELVRLSELFVQAMLA